MYKVTLVIKNFVDVGVAAPVVVVTAVAFAVIIDVASTHLKIK